jgi:hypothetical protein
LCYLIIRPKLKQINQLLFIGILLIFIASAQSVFAQKPRQQQKRQIAKVVKKNVAISQQLKNFQQLAAQANVTFSIPKGFKEIQAPNNEDISYDYAMQAPGQEFEVWFQVKSQKENYASYQRSIGNKSTMQANPDSVYLGMGTAQAIAFTGESQFFIRTVPASHLARYNADAGKTYLLNLLDEPITKHYKYALLVTLQKYHTGTILAVCFGNEKGPEFFKNIDKASTCLKFKP